jgi:prepilin-type processing-associated H-X9-DG protein
VIFGDGEYGSGANKFMRAPLRHVEDQSDEFMRASGAQGFRHRGKSNAAFVDGHVESLGIRPAERIPAAWAGEPGAIIMLGKGNGFLSQDNSLYDLK